MYALTQALTQKEDFKVRDDNKLKHIRGEKDLSHEDAVEEGIRPSQSVGKGPRPTRVPTDTTEVHLCGRGHSGADPDLDLHLDLVQRDVKVTP